MIPIAKVIVSPTEPTGKNRKKVWMQKGKNLFNKNNIENVLYIDGSASPNSNWIMSEFITVLSNTKYVMNSSLKSGQTSGQIQINEFDENRNFIATNFQILISLNFTTKNNTKYLRIAYRGDKQENTMLEQGSTATDYEAYIEPKIYIKNSNDIYEEFIKKEEISKLSFTKNDANNIYYYDMYATENEVQINADVRYSYSSGTNLKAFTISNEYLPLIFNKSEGQLRFPVTTDKGAVGYAYINSNGEVYIYTYGTGTAAYINIRYRYR